MPKTHTQWQGPVSKHADEEVFSHCFHPSSRRTSIITSFSFHLLFSLPFILSLCLSLSLHSADELTNQSGKEIKMKIGLFRCTRLYYIVRLLVQVFRCLKQRGKKKFFGFHIPVEIISIFTWLDWPAKKLWCENLTFPVDCVHTPSSEPLYDSSWGKASSHRHHHF